MTNVQMNSMVQVTLPKAMISSMLVMQDEFRMVLVEALRASQEAQAEEDVRPAVTSVDASDMAGSKYFAELLGQRLTAATLPMLLGEFVDQMAIVAPEALEALSLRRSRKRRYVARHWEAIHPGRPDLDVLQTASGWWVSSNIGKDDLIRALKELSRCAGLEFAKEVKFPA